MPLTKTLPQAAASDLDPFDSHREERSQTCLDGDLINQVARGSEQAVVILYDRYSRLVYSVALRVLREPVAAEDVLQEIFMQLWRTPSRFVTTKSTLAGWLAVTTRNRSIDVLRARRATEPVDEHSIVSSLNVAAEAEQHLMLAKARLFIEQLPSEQRRTLEMAFFHDMTHSEIAKITGIPLGTVKTRIRTALQSLRMALIG